MRLFPLTVNSRRKQVPRFTSALGPTLDVICPKADIEDADQKAGFARPSQPIPGCRSAGPVLDDFNKGPCKPGQSGAVI